MLKKVILINYRNIAKADISPSPTTTVVFGENGQGKTNLIEGIYLACILKAVRAPFDKELIRFGEDTAVVTVFFEQEQLEISVFPWGKEIRLNTKVKTGLEVLGKFKAIMFSPRDLELVFGPPVNRRKFLDIVLALTDQEYLYNLASYNRVLKQRNKVLLFLNEGRSEDLDIWSQELINYGARLWLKRATFLKDINEIFKKISADLSNLGTLHLEYETKIKTMVPKSEKQIKQSFALELNKARNSEIKFKTTLIGPHRDDFKIISETIFEEKVISKDLGSFGSQGEARIAAVCLKLAEIEYFKERGNDPTFLLDDVFSELDKTHQENLIKILDKNQTIITTNSLDIFPENVQKKALILKIAAGKIEEFKTE